MAEVAATDEQALEVDCSMAQAFEIPRKNRTAFWLASRQATTAAAKVPATLSGPPLRLRPAGRIDTSNMGLTPDRCKRQEVAPARSDRPDSRLGDPRQG
jgi:hypothetical protein